jgi:glycine dehydrogenase subunit 2
MMVRALAYMMSHGADGLQRVAEDAVLNANYMLHHLKGTFNVPFKGYCMHECLLTDKHLKDKHVSTLDIAKGLIEYGYHPMTVYFPLVVSGAMLIEPTETESKQSLDEFINTMKHLAHLAETNGEDTFKQFPLSTPRRRLDEVKAARQPILKWEKPE